MKLKYDVKALWELTGHLDNVVEMLYEYETETLDYSVDLLIQEIVKLKYGVVLANVV
jgi:hypothetical protein